MPTYNVVIQHQTFYEDNLKILELLSRMKGPQKDNRYLHVRFETDAMRLSFINYSWRISHEYNSSWIVVVKTLTKGKGHSKKFKFQEYDGDEYVGQKFLLSIAKYIHGEMVKDYKKA